MALPIALGGASLLSGLAGNKSAQKSANKSASAASGLVNRQSALFDSLMKIVQGADASGQFSPDKRLAQLKDDTARYESTDSGNTAGAARIAGFKPGDSELTNALSGVHQKYAYQYNALANDIRDKAFSNKLGAYESINPASLNAGIGFYQQQQQNALGQEQNPSALIAPFAASMSQTQRKRPVGFAGVNPNTYQGLGSYDPNAAAY